MEASQIFNLWLKAIVYRLIRIIIVLIVSLCVLGDFGHALSISMLDAIVATVYYYYFDKFWDNLVKPWVYQLYIKIKYRGFK